MNQESEFGRGFIYNLILFAKHYYWHNDFPAQFWFDAAADHFEEFEIPEQFKDTEIGNLAKELEDFCDTLKDSFGRIVEITNEDKEEAFHKLEKLAMLIDKELGLEDVEARFK